ncbi:MAG: hypothetical protein L0214_00065 [candidate division NC10 bacterium]|nr:hypothetical protein [candidate division NC10 bacterium]
MIGAVVVVLAAAAIGCTVDPRPPRWAATGSQLAHLEMPLGGSEHAFIVSEYALEGREGPEPGAREFRDRLLLTTHLRGQSGRVWGYATRTYADGTTRIFGISGMVRPEGPNLGVIALAAWVHEYRLDGPVSYGPTDAVELRLDRASGRISAEAS